MKIDSKGKLVSWTDMSKDLAFELQGKSYEETLALWEDWEQEFAGTELYPDWVRSMVLADRYFLMVNFIFKEKDRHMVLHPWIFERCREVEAEPDECLDLWARGHMKTTIITECGSIQEILRDPDITVAIFSHTKAGSIVILGNIRRHLQDPVLISLFPDILYSNPERDAENWTRERITVKRTINVREATCSAHGVIDNQPIGAHFKLMVYDDLVTQNAVTTPDQIEKTTSQLALSYSLGTADARKRFIGTRYSLGDTYQSMIEGGSVKVRLYAATRDGTPDGDTVYFTQEQWEKVKENPGMDISTLSCQYLQNPNAGTQAAFPMHKLRFYFKSPTLMNVYILVDPASKKKVGADKTAIAVIGVDKTGNKFLLDGFNHRMGLSEKWDCIRKLYKKWDSNPAVLQVRVGYEMYGMQSDIPYMYEQMEVERFWFDIVELNGRQSKVDRMKRLEPDIRAGRFHVPEIVGIRGKRFVLKQVEDPSTRKRHPHTGELMPGTGQIRIQNVPLEREILRDGARFRIQALAEGGSGKLAENIGRRALVRLNTESNKPYDLTAEFIAQATQVPNNQRYDDLVDAVSRIYDMDIVFPSIYAKTTLSQPDRDAGWDAGVGVDPAREDGAGTVDFGQGLY